MWTNQQIDYNNVLAGAKLTSAHTYKGDKQIKSIEPSCSCISIDRYLNTIKVHWKTRKDIPEEYISFKYITITYKDGTVDEIELKAKLVKL